MAKAQCPFCGCKSFYVKDPDDEYETYEFEMETGGPRFTSDAPEDERPELVQDTHCYCNQCAWHGPLQELEK
jgi:hypothetical protein